MKKWYQKYLSSFGDFTIQNNHLFIEIKNNLSRLAHGQIDVSIVVIAYNEESNILPCIWSLSEIQTDLSVEIIVVNNASTDRTQEILDKTGVKSVWQPIPGHGHARQAGLDVAKGKYHFSADADTLYPPYYIDTMIRYLSRPGVSVVFSTYYYYSNGQKSQLSLEAYCFWRDIIIRLRSKKRPELCVGGAAMGFYAEQARQVKWRTDIRRGEDGVMLARLKKYGKPTLVLKKRARVRSSSRRLDADGSLFSMIWKRFLKDIRRISEFFTRAKGYKDRSSNLR